jgi:hypothetical protein
MKNLKETKKILKKTWDILNEITGKSKNNNSIQCIVLKELNIGTVRTKLISLTNSLVVLARKFQTQ